MGKRVRKAAVRLSRVDLERLARGEVTDSMAAVREPEPRLSTEKVLPVSGGLPERETDAWLKENVPPHW